MAATLCQRGLDEKDFGRKYSGELLYDAILDVHEVHSGEPNAFDVQKVWSVYDLTAGKPKENSITLICTRLDETLAFAMHFPDDQHEVELVEDDDDSFFSDDTNE